MTTILIILSFLTFLIILISNIEIFLVRNSVSYLRDVEPQFDKSAPCVSIIVPACNEEKEIAAALQSLLGQDYPNLEIIVINDRSTDRTGEILDEFARNHSGLQVIHITKLPEDWLGKNHALHLGSTHARGQYLLFTDADVIMAKTTVSKAVQFTLDHNLDHLAVAPEIRATTWKIDLMIGTFIYYFNLITKPWRAQNPNSRYSVGIGAFNLLKAETYKAIGTHRAIAMRPDDDIMLGRLVKSRGYRQQVVFGKRQIRIQWYFSVRDMIAGLMKNTASFVNYSLVGATIWCLALFLLFVFPFIAVLITPAPACWFYLATATIITVIYLFATGEYHLTRWYALLIPFSTCVLIYIILKASIQTHRNKGIYWRGMFYPLDKLRRFKI